MGQRSPKAADSLQQPKFTSALLVGALLFLVALAISALYELDRSRHEAQQRAAHEIDALARVFAEQTRRSLQTVDIMLRSLAEAHHDKRLPPLDSREMHLELAAQRDQFSDVAAVFVDDAQGARLNSSTSYPPPAGSVPGSALISALQKRSRDDVFVGESVRRLTTGSWVVPLARRLEGPGGRLDGVVGAFLDSSYFDNFYAAVHLEPGTSVSLLSGGGTLVAKFPTQDDQVGRPVAEYRDLRREDAASNPPSVLRDPGGAPDRIAVARRVPGFEMTIVVSRQLREVLAAWREQAFWVALRTGILALMVVALLVMVRRHLARGSTRRARNCASPRSAMRSPWPARTKGCGTGTWRPANFSSPSAPSSSAA